MSTQKTLSTGTLSLRFMQNAQRAKQQQKVELERAAVKDEAEWEVSPEVRKAWGLASDTSDRNAHVVTCDSSYLPFIYGFHAEDDPGPSRPRGRRTFNKKGEETTGLSDQRPEEVSSSSPSETSPPKGKMYARPSSISLSSSKNAMNPKHKKQNEKSTFTSSRDAVFGFSLADGPPDFKESKPTTTISTNAIDSASVASSSSIFLKPAGVDSPSAHPPITHSIASSTKNKDILPEDARTEKKVKRTRKDSEVGGKGEVPKKKKKRQQPAE